MDDDYLDGCQLALDWDGEYLDGDETLALAVLFAGIAAHDLERVAAYWRSIRG